MAIWCFLAVGSMSFTVAPMYGSLMCYAVYSPGGDSLPNICVPGDCDADKCEAKLKGASLGSIEIVDIECICAGSPSCTARVRYTRSTTNGQPNGPWGPWEFHSFTCSGPCDPNGYDSCYQMAPSSGQGLSPGDRLCGCT